MKIKTKFDTLVYKPYKETSFIHFYILNESLLQNNLT